MEKKDDKNKTTFQYGSLLLPGSNTSSNAERYLSAKNISYARITVSSWDIDSETEAKLSVDNVEIENGINKNPVIIENIPAGNNRIISVIPYDKNGEELSSQTIRGVTNIDAGKQNSVTIDKTTTAYGTVLYGIKDIYNFDLLEQEGSLKKIRDVINDKIHPSLFDSSKLIGELKGFQIPVNTDSTPYELKPGSVIFDYIIDSDFTAQINDPLSAPLKNQQAANGITISGIAPGNWKLSITDASGNTIDSTDIQIKSGSSQNIGHIVPNGIVVTARTNLTKNGNSNFKNLHFWNLTYPENTPEVEKLTQKLSKIKLTKTVLVKNPIDEQTGTPDENHSSLFVYRFSKATAVSLLLTNTRDVKYCESDITINRQGVYCIHSTGVKPVTKEEAVSPIDLSELNISTDHLKKCFIDDYKNQRFIVLFSEKLYGSAVTSLKACFNKGINDAETENNGEYNGNHYTMVKDSSGIWYCAVPYSDVQETNQSGQPSYNFKVNSSIITPPAFVPEGYIYQKFNGSQGKNRYLVLIYSEHSDYFTLPEKTITANLAAAKKCRKLSDFDLSTEEGKKQISNFRLVPGTTTLYRSFHPIKDDKMAISDTSKKRMECLAELSAAAGIKYDINLSDDNLKSATYSIPSYYQKLIDTDNIFYMTRCSYGTCYSQSDSTAFAEGIKLLLEKISITPGPYQFHCAIGTDRTGICGAIIAGICGADWNSIQEDYYKSIQMGIYEYRGPGCVRYAMQNFLGAENISKEKELQAKIISTLKKRTSISASTIKKAIENLGGKLPD